MPHRHGRSWGGGVENQRAKGKVQNDSVKVKEIRRVEGKQRRPKGVQTCVLPALSRLRLVGGNVLLWPATWQACGGYGKGSCPFLPRDCGDSLHCV